MATATYVEPEVRATRDRVFNAEVIELLVANDEGEIWFHADSLECMWRFGPEDELVPAEMQDTLTELATAALS